jgi:hypothetical protein
MADCGGCGLGGCYETGLLAADAVQYLVGPGRGTDLLVLIGNLFSATRNALLIDVRPIDASVIQHPSDVRQ